MQEKHWHKEAQTNTQELTKHTSCSSAHTLQHITGCPEASFASTWTLQRVQTAYSTHREGEGERKKTMRKLSLLSALNTHTHIHTNTRDCTVIPQPGIIQQRLYCILLKSSDWIGQLGGVPKFPSYRCRVHACFCTTDTCCWCQNGIVPLSPVTNYCIMLWHHFTPLLVWRPVFSPGILTRQTIQQTAAVACSSCLTKTLNRVFTTSSMKVHRARSGARANMDAHISLAHFPRIQKKSICC